MPVRKQEKVGEAVVLPNAEEENVLSEVPPKSVVTVAATHVPKDRTEHRELTERLKAVTRPTRKKEATSPAAKNGVTEHVVLKRQTTGNSSLKIKSLTSARKDGHAESRKRSNRQNSHYKVMLEKKKI